MSVGRHINCIRAKKKMLYVPDDKFVLIQNAVDLAMCVFDDK